VYITLANLRATLAPDGAADESTAASMTDAALTREIVRAQAEVDGHLLDRYGAPFSDAEVPALIKSITEDIAAYLATLTHRRTGSLDENDVIWLRYSRASALLERIGEGAIDLGVAGTGVVSVGPTVVNPSHDVLFPLDSLGLYSTGY